MHEDSVSCEALLAASPVFGNMPPTSRPISSKATSFKCSPAVTSVATALGVAANRIKHGDSASAQDIWVYDDPDQEFEITDDGVAGTLSAANVGATFAMILTTGNTTTGQSKHELDTSSTSASAAEAVLLEGFKTGPSFLIGKYASAIVKLNRHIWKTGSAGI